MCDGRSISAQVVGCEQCRNPPIGKFLKIAGTRLHYFERGTGLPIVFLHLVTANSTVLRRILFKRILDGYLHLATAAEVDRLAVERFLLCSLLAEGHNGWDLPITQRWPQCLARQRSLDEGREFLLLFLLARAVPPFERRHHHFGEQLKRLADVGMLVVSALLQEYHLVNTSLLEPAHVLGDLLGRADAAGARGYR